MCFLADSSCADHLTFSNFNRWSLPSTRIAPLPDPRLVHLGDSFDPTCGYEGEGPPKGSSRYSRPTSSASLFSCHLPGCNNQNFSTSESLRIHLLMHDDAATPLPAQRTPRPAKYDSNAARAKALPCHFFLQEQLSLLDTTSSTSLFSCYLARPRERRPKEPKVYLRRFVPVTLLPVLSSLPLYVQVAMTPTRRNTSRIIRTMSARMLKIL